MLWMVLSQRLNSSKQNPTKIRNADKKFQKHLDFKGVIYPVYM